MPKTFHLHLPDLLPEVQRRLRAGGSQRHLERLQAVRLGLAGEHTLAQIAAAVGRARSRIGAWMRLVREQGLDALLGRHQGRGRTPQVNAKVLAQLRQGLRRGRWKRAKEAGAWLAQRHGVQLTEGGVRYWLKKAGSLMMVYPRA